MTDPTCAERIAEQLQSRADDVRKMLAAQSGETFCQHCGESITEEEEGSESFWTTDYTDSHGRSCPMADEHEPDEDYNEDSLAEFGLGLSRKVVLRFDMSTGGPADWLEILCDAEQTGGDYSVERLTVERVTYHFSDWFDHAEQVVEDGPLFELAEWIAETQS